MSMLTQTPLLHETIPANFARIVGKYGDREAVICAHQNIRLTYGQLDANSTQLAKGFSRLGTRKGDRVAVSLGNNAELATITYALAKLGAILVPLNPGFNVAQIASALNHLSVRHYVIGSTTTLPFKPPRDNSHILEGLLRHTLVESLEDIIVVNPRADQRLGVDFGDVVEDGIGELPDEKLVPEDIVNIQFTSGTTSAPKAVCLTHSNLVNNGKAIGDRMRLTHEDILCCPPPLFHCFGSVLGYMAAMTHGSSIVFPAEAFDPLATLQAVADERATVLHGVPTMFLSELELLKSGAFVPPAWKHGRNGPAFPSLRTGIASGAPVPSEMMKRLVRDLNLSEITICYGMTETSPVSCHTEVDDPIERRLYTVGKPLPHVGVKIVDPSDRNRILPVGQRGELAASGYLLMKGYWGDEKRTNEAMLQDCDGVTWMHTGDEASMDADGYVSITGRIKDLIIRGGENIHPTEIENCLLSHPAVSDSSVVGLPDERYGEAVAAFVVLRDLETPQLEAQLREHVRITLSNHLIPKYIWFVDQLPKTESGKIKKYQLRTMGSELVQKLAI